MCKKVTGSRDFQASILFGNKVMANGTVHRHPEKPVVVPVSIAHAVRVGMDALRRGTIPSVIATVDDGYVVAHIGSDLTLRREVGGEEATPLNDPTNDTAVAMIAIAIVNA